MVKSGLFEECGTMKMFKILTAGMFLLFMTGMAGASGKIVKTADDKFKIILTGLQRDSIRILQVTDLHLGNKRGWAKSFATINRVKKLARQLNPDIIAVTGDLLTGEKTDSEALAGFARILFDDLQIPWFFTFGNHDPEGGDGREPIRQIFSASDWGLLGFHSIDSGTIKCDYRIDLEIENDPTPAWQFYVFDSGSEPGNRSIKKDQQEWFKEQSLQSKHEFKKIIPAVAFFHIPLKQYIDLWNDSTLVKTGFLHEKVCLEEDDGSVYQAFLDQGNIIAVFCGHDHDNNYWGKYKGGILLAYGHVTGDSGYHRHWPPGAKLISLPLKKGEIGIKDIVME
jgi:3',5'-cyclic AMP phosphodiesterase CpdA